MTLGIASIALLLLPALSGRPVTSAFSNLLPNTNHYKQTNLLSNLPGKAHFRDPDLKNAWGMAFFPNGPFWISDNNSGFSSVCEANGQLDFVVKIPLPPGSTSSFAAPTGIVANGTADFSIGASGPAFFIFSSEDGTITAWNGGSTAVLVANEAPAHAIYKGLAMANNGGANFLYATDFHNAKVQVFDKNFHPTTLAGTFHDASIPAGFAPFGIVNIKGQLFITYALQDSKKINDQPGPGNGFVRVFDTAGHLITTKPMLSHGALNSPWGVAVAPSNFGAFSNDLLVGNLGDGTIHAYNPTSGALLGELDDLGGQPIVIGGLWDLVFGDGSAGKPTNTLFFSAGIDGQNDGLFGSLVTGPAAPTPTPTRKPTPTPSRKPTRTATRKPTPTPTRKLVTPTPTRKPTRTATRRPTPTATRKPTPTSSRNPTPTATRKPTPTSSRKPTPTASRKPTPTATKKPTPTATRKPSPTPTRKVPTPTPTPYRFPYH
jgi:uncharacterized protein (TIGR03118 family)